MAEEHLHDTIEKYLLGELSAQEQAQLEARMATDATLSERVEIQRLALMGLQRLAAADMREKFDLWDEEIDAPTSLAAHSKPKRWIWTAALLFLLLTAGIFWHFWQIGKLPQSQDSGNGEIAQRDSVIAVMRLDFQKQLDSLSARLILPGDSFSVLEIKRLREAIDLKDKRLRDLESELRVGKPQIAMQFAPLPNQAKRGGASGADPTLVAEKNAFDAKDFAESIRLLKGIPTNDPRQEEVTQRLPYSLFYAKDYSAAIPAFVDLLLADPFEEANARWYLLLCYVATGQESETRMMFHVILSNQNTKYHQKATDLKRALNL